MYAIRFVAYTGCSPLRDVYDGGEAARDVAAERIRNARTQGIKVTILTRGAKWEFLEDDAAVMIGDDKGVLYLEHYTFECDECGHEHETAEDARECCQQDDWADDLGEFDEYEITEAGDID